MNPDTIPVSKPTEYPVANPLNAFRFGLYVDPDMWIVTSDLTGVKFSGVTPFFNIMEWDFAQ